MKILVLSNLYPPDVIGGYELGCKQAVDALRARGHDVRVLTIAPRVPVPDEPHVHRSFKLSRGLEQQPLRPRPEPRRFQPPPGSRSDRRQRLQRPRLIPSDRGVPARRRLRLDDRRDRGSGLDGDLAAHAGPLGLAPDGRRPGPALPEPGSGGRAALLKELNRQLDGRFLACSRQLVDEIEALGVRLSPRVEVVPNWVVGDAPAPRRGAYRPGDTLRVIAAGQVAQHKGVDILIEAVAEVRARGYANIAVDIYGNVEDSSFPALVRGLGVGDLVRFRGRDRRRNWGGCTPITTCSPSRPGHASRSPSPRSKPAGGGASR